MKEPVDVSWVRTTDPEPDPAELRGMLWFLGLALLIVVVAAAIVLGAAGLAVYALATS